MNDKSFETVKKTILFILAGFGVLSIISLFLILIIDYNGSPLELDIVADNTGIRKDVEIEIDGPSMIKDYLIFRIGKDSISEVSEGRAHASFYERNIFVNLLFISKKTFEKRLLFKKDVLIINHKLANFYNKEDYICDKNILEVVSKDTNGNRKYDVKDSNDLYVSDYNGMNLHIIMKDIKEWDMIGTNTVLIIQGPRDETKSNNDTYSIYYTDKKQLVELFKVKDILR